MNSIRMLLISEFRGQSGSPVGMLVSDFEKFLLEQGNITVRYFATKHMYQPGGLKLRRLVNLFTMHLFLIFIIPLEKLKAIYHGEKNCIMSTTSPPLIQWTACLLGRLFNIPCVVWLQDAHPEIEARAFESKGLSSIAKVLRALNAKIVSHSKGIVALDEAMKITFIESTQSLDLSAIIPPWSTYLEPAQPLRVPQRFENLKLIYAGNYGKVHDLGPLVKKFLCLDSTLQQRISCTFIGMNPESQNLIETLFEPTEIRRIFMARANSLDDLKAVFSEHDLGVVSLSAQSQGLACPSKALSYLSQGLPILYVGPENSMPWDLIKKGWGILPEEIENLFALSSYNSMSARRGQILPNPKNWSLNELLKMVHQVALNPTEASTMHSIG